MKYKKLDIESVNNSNKLDYMVAKDLFDDNGKQVFDAKTGNYLGTIGISQEIDLPAPVAPETPQETIFINPNQTTLF